MSKVECRWCEAVFWGHFRHARATIHAYVSHREELKEWNDERS